MSAVLLDRDPERIAAFRALFLGDLLCALPAITAMKRRFPRAELTLIGLPWARELAERIPAIDRFEPFPGWPTLPDSPCDAAALEEFLARMRARRFDLAVQLHGSGATSNEVVVALGARRSIGYGPTGDWRLDQILPWDESDHEIRRWLRLAAALGADAGETDIALPIGTADQRAADDLLGATGDAPVVGLHAGAKLPSRRWPAEQFAALGDGLSERDGARIVLTGSAGEGALTGAVAAAMRAPALDLAGRTDLGAFAAVVARLDLLVTNDTGASHVAAATRTRSVVLFGPTAPARWAPLDRSRHTVVSARALVSAADDELLAHLPLGPVLAACEAALAASRSSIPILEPV